MGTKATDILQRVDETSGVTLNYRKTTTWYDGSSMTNIKTDGVIYRKKGTDYYVMTFDNLKTEYLIKATMSALRSISATEILLLKMGVYKGVELQGYYQKGDTPASIIYNFNPATLVDDGGGIIVVSGGSFVHVFDVIDPLYFGAIGDGVTDDADIMEKVFRKGIKVSNSKNTFFITRSISATGVLVDIDSLNIKIDFRLTNTVNVTFNESAIKTGVVNNTTTIQELATTLTLDDGTGVNADDLIVIKCSPQITGSIIVNRSYVIKTAGGNFASVGATDNNVGTSFKATGTTPDYGTGGSLLVLWDFDPRPDETDVTLGEVHKVIKAVGNVITLDVPLNTQYSSTFNLTYAVYRPKPFNINNFSLTSDFTGAFGGLSVAFKTPTITNSYFGKVSGIVGISLGSCYNANITNIKVEDGYYTGTATGYGIQDNGSTKTSIVGCIFSNNRRGVDFSGVFPSHLGIVDSCIGISNPASNNSGSCFGTHGGADLTTFQNNICIGGIIGIQLRGGRCSIKGNTFIGNLITCVSISFSNSVTIEKNQVSYNRDYTNQVSSYFVQTNSTSTFSKTKPLVIKDNNIFEIRTGIIGYNSADNITVNGIQLLNNNITLRSNIGSNAVGLLVNTSAGVVTLRNSIFDKNNISTIVGTYSPVVGGILDSVFNYGDLGRPITSTDLVQWTGPGAVSAVTLNVVQQTLNNINANVKGTITFTVTGGATTGTGVKLQNLLRAPVNLNDFYSTTGNPLMISSAGELFIGYEFGDNYNSLFPDGTYTVNFNISYPLNNSFLY